MTTDGAEEFHKLAADLTAAPLKVAARAGSAMAKTLADIQRGAQNRAPVDTGNLKGSISSEVQRRGDTVRGEVGPTASYGAYVERGTSRMKAQPYLRPATDAALPGYEAALGQLGVDAIGGG